MAEAVVADGHRRFGDVALAAAQQFGGALHADFAQVLLDGHAGFLRKKAAQIKRAATNFSAELFERRRVFEAFAQNDAHALDAIARRALGARAEKFTASRTEEKQRGEFKGFAAEPDFAGGLEDRTLLQALEELQMKRAQAFGFADAAEFRGAVHNVSDDWVEIFFLAGEMFAQEIARKFHGNESMFLIGETQGFEAWLALVIKNERPGADFDFLFTVGNEAETIEIEADFNAVWMKRARPIEIVRGMKFVPFEAEAELCEAAEHWPPARADGAPGGFFHEDTGGDGGIGIAGEFHRRTPVFAKAGGD